MWMTGIDAPDQSVAQVSPKEHDSVFLLIGPATLHPPAAKRSTPMADQNDQQPQRLERQYKVRQVTNIQASWTEQQRGEEGKFTIQLILDNGVEEYILQPDADDVEPMLKLFAMSDHANFDLERKVLMFSNLKIK
jgi:hypothetical protein